MTTTQKITEYKVLLQINFKNVLTAGQMVMAQKDAAIKMLDAESTGGTVAKITEYISWIQTKPLAMQYLTASTPAAADFQTAIAATWTTASAGLPSTYIALHAETVGNEPKLNGLLALRALGVDPAEKIDAANIAGGGGSGAALSDAAVIALYGTYGATKFNAIFNKGTLKAIMNDTNTSYDTIDEVATLYSAWPTTAGTVPLANFFSGIKKIYDASYTGLKFSDIMAYQANLTNFNKYTSDAACSLMAATGGTWTAVIGLSADKYAAMTTANVVDAIKHCGATYTQLNTAYGNSPAMLASICSDNARALVKGGYLTFAQVITGYGTTYTTAADAQFNSIIDSSNFSLFKNGMTFAHVSAGYAAQKLNGFTGDVLQIMNTNHAQFDTVANDLVTMTSSSPYAGLEAISVFG